MVCLEVWKVKRLKGKAGKERRGTGNGYPFPLFRCFKNEVGENGINVYLSPFCLDVVGGGEAGVT